MERDDEIEKISKELEDILRMTSEKKRSSEETETEKKNLIPSENGTDKKTPSASLEDFSLILDLGDGDVVSSDSAEVSPAGGDGEEGPGTVQSPAEGGPVSSEGGQVPDAAEPLSRLDSVQEDPPDLFLEPVESEEYDYEEDLEFPDQEALEFSDQEEPAYDEREGKRRRDGRESICLIRPSDGLVAAFFVPVIIMIIIFAQRGIFPFGEESFLRTDMYHQYAPFFSEFQHKLTHGGSFLYSWDVGMGVNFAALYAYYLASPLNWLLALCPKAYIIEFMTYMIVFKIGLSGLSFAYYLRKHCKTSDFGIAFFGIFYALSGYMAAYSWNIMWLDCILLFPLIMLGLERLVREKKCFLYCITLGLSILSNYYISIMICIFMVLYFIALLVMDGKKSWKDYMVNISSFAVFSLLAGGLAAVVLLPEIYALQMTASGDFNFPKTVTSYFPIFDMLARHLPDVETEIGLDHWPNIYCGVAVLMLFLLYLVNRNIKRREKVVYCGLLLFFFASFSFNVLNFIWHGFHYPNSLPCRQSFIYIFLMLLMCYQAYSHLKETPWKHVVLAFFAAIAFVLMAQKLITDEAYHFPCSMWRFSSFRPMRG